jgi:hypothetical protein
MINSDKFEDLKIYILIFTRLSFLCSKKYKVFGIDILHVCEINYWIHLETFFNFFESLRCDFRFI